MLALKVSLKGLRGSGSMPHSVPKNLTIGKLQRNADVGADPQQSVNGRIGIGAGLLAIMVEYGAFALVHSAAE